MFIGIAVHAALDDHEFTRGPNWLVPRVGDHGTLQTALDVAVRAGPGRAVVQNTPGVSTAFWIVIDPSGATGPKCIVSVRQRVRVQPV